MDTKALINQARQAVAETSCNPKKLTAIHAGIAAAAGLAVALLSYLLGTGIGDTGGLSGIGTRAVLETAQSVLDLAVSILSPFWALGFVAVALRIARRENAEPRTLLTGFRLWGPVLRLMLVEGMILFGIVLVAVQIGSFIYTLTPFAASLNALVQQLTDAGNASTDALTQLLLELDHQELMKIFWSMMPFMVLPAVVVLVPLSYRLRLAQYILLDQPRLGAMYALLLSFKLMKNNCLKLFTLDLRLWWFYALEILVTALCYGELLLPLVGVTPEGNGVLLSFLFYAVALLGQLGLYVWQKSQVATAYALFYDSLLPKEEPQTEEI